MKTSIHDTQIKNLEEAVAEKKVLIDGVQISQNHIDNRLTRVEDAIAAFKDVIPELQSIGKLTQKLDIVIDLDRKRIENLENKVFSAV